ncbi:MAG: peptidyl-tRNA hydrolase Pth2 [Nitrososphaeraceae archaeon]|jgi:PTH2 family peptidyl-tRNA hydrolase|nr:peptidyl-tRNA hydrolase Pth2 [Nitrososphaeraceae archaeon]MDW3611567.1 peptidyl-tRNA hydrolase Pth2 [Nitrososphaeraceae archaeon]MDW3625223.1 peptidyl-tRNA hydrolase Pth2 [Nitrososphaeraceae archaeon]
MELKQVIIVRKDLKMGSGKLAAQVAHAAILASEKARNKNFEWFKEWFNFGQPKIILKVNSLKELEAIHKLGQFNNLATAIVIDAGLTQLDAGTATCVGIGPAPISLIDKITGGLKLL